jgi:hypothetical protein
LYCFALQHFREVREAYLRGVGADGLNNRQAELWRPLLAIAAYVDRLGREGLLQQVQEYARRNAEQAEEDGLDDERRALLLALHQLATEETKWVRPKEVGATMADFMENERHAAITDKWVGNRLKEFGLRRKRANKGSIYLITREIVMDLMQRYGLEVPADSENCTCTNDSP